MKGKYFVIRLWDWRILTLCRGNRSGWIRVLGLGLSWKDTRIHGLRFSERYGYRKGFQLGRWRFNKIYH